MAEMNWYGLDETRFRKYRKFINRQTPGVCGTYCASVMVHDQVLQDTGKFLNHKLLLAGMQQVVDDYHLHRGTFIWNLQTGLNLVLADTPYRAKGGLFTERNIPPLIDAGYGPFIVGTLGILGSRYGNHWVLVYAYAYDEDGDLFYRCYNNHGRHDAVIKAAETFSYVYLVNQDKESQATEENADFPPVTFSDNLDDQQIVFKTNPYYELALASERIQEQKRKERHFLEKAGQALKDWFI